MRNELKMKLITFFSFAFLIFAMNTAHSNPLLEAQNACAAKADGEQCSFKGPKGNALNGNCRKGPNGGLHCVPKPPQAAIDACAKKAEGDNCNFTTPNKKSLDGACVKRPRLGEELVCVPKPPQAAFDACNAKKAGDSCTFSGRENRTVNGACRQAGPFGKDKLVCGPMKAAKVPGVKSEEGKAAPAANKPEEGKAAPATQKPANVPGAKPDESTPAEQSVQPAANQ